jgi:hypothetical protein
LVFEFCSINLRMILNHLKEKQLQVLFAKISPYQFLYFINFLIFKKMKKLTLLLISLFATVWANAETLSGTVSNGTTTSATAITAEATVSDGVVSFTQFLGVDLSFDVTPYSNGHASSSISAGYQYGSFAAGDFGTATGLYLYGGVSDCTYAESDGAKTIEFALYTTFDENASSNSSYAYYYYTFTLPSDFEASEEPYLGQPYTLTASVTSGDDGYGYGETFFEEAQQVSFDTYVDANSITLTNYLGGTTSITYTIADDGTISGGVPYGYTYTNYTVGDYTLYCISAYGGKATYDATTRTVTDEFYIYENGSAYTYLKVSFVLPQLASATTTINGETATFVVPYVLGDADGVITLPNIFGSTLSPTFTIKESGVVSNDIVNNNYKYYDSVLGKLGAYNICYTNDQYTTQSYSSKNGTLSLAFWKNGGSQLTIVVTLPSDFTPEPSPYYGEPVAITATIVSGDDGYGYGTNYFEDQQVSLTAYAEGNDIVVTNYLGGTGVITYTIADDGTITGGVPAGYTYTDYTVGDNNFYAISAYGNKATYDADTRTVTDEYYIYVNGGSAYSYFKVSFVLPYLTDATATFNGESSTFKVAYTLGEDGEITFPSFLGTSLSPTFTITETGSVSNDIVNNNYTYYDSVLGELGAYNIYYSNDSYTTQKYANNDGVQTLSLTVWEDATYGKPTIVITLPEDFKVLELEKNAKVYTLSGDPEAETGEPILVHLDYTISGSLVTITKPFGGSRVSLPFTMQTDGTVASTYGYGRFTDSYTFNGNTYAALVDDSRTYDVENKVLVWTFGLTNDPNGKVNTYADAEEHYVLYLQLPDDFEASAPQKIQSCTAGIYASTDRGIYALASTTAKVDVLDYDSNKVTITSIFDSTVKVGLSWDDAGDVTVDGEFTYQYYSIGSDYYGEIKINSVKYVKDDADEYFDLNITTGTGYYGGAAYENASFRIYLTKTTVDLTTITVSAYDWDEEADDYGDLSSSLAHVYELQEGQVALYNLLGSDINLLVKFYSLPADASSDDDGEVETGLEAGTYTGTFQALGSTYTQLRYEGDEEASCWYTSGRSKYFEMTAWLSNGDGDEVQTIIMFSIPRNITYFDGVNDLTVDGSDSNAAVEYYNLQGIRVNNPQNGLYIRRQGKNVSKVLVK